MNGSQQRAEECWDSHKLLALPTVMGCENKIIVFKLHLLRYPVPRLLCLHHFKFLLSLELHMLSKMFPEISQHFVRKCSLCWRINDTETEDVLLSLLMEEVLLCCSLYVQIRFRGQTSAGCSVICWKATTRWPDPSSTTLIPSRFSSTSVSCRS